MADKQIGLLVMAYGTPRNIDEIEPYYTHIRRGRKPTPELLDTLIERYKLIGGVSPLSRITEEQAEQLEYRLNERHANVTFKAYVGLKHIEPYIENVVQQMKEDGIEQAISIVLAPHQSTFSTDSYNNRAHEESEKIGGPAITSIDSWYSEPSFLDFWSDRIRDTFDQIPTEAKAHTIVIFSAHSLPEKIIQMKDPYPGQIADNAKLIAERAGIAHYTTAWQSAGRTPEPWLGPDILDKIRELHKEGYTSMIFCPIGFVADHLEVLYDNDYECKKLTDELGIRYYRPAMPNTDPRFIEALACAVEKKLI
ncbi:ferrochelatase [Aneurinibacillus sp. Ricciae_BoGa-3]|uniref:ferrochelatase n=1 Tax=Aneurinibacillus sp. Ricciae_BoGa-3 TaxID=3022697 RepID=UPI00233F7E8C|nr:ferrochelatase [Aneurinibacillus sp. Ricciae_BoGa-3]WCK56874.1 ferrochelatase [Aneurinibacillus sp. Ricciae_BoGa-3]